MTVPPQIISQAGSSGSMDVTTVRGKNFSVERYYMLSEIEQQALLPVYLDDYFPSEAASSSNNTVATVASETEYHCHLPPFAVLYLLWNCSRASANSESAEEAAHSFRTDVLEKALEKLEKLSANKGNPGEEEDNDNEESTPPLNVYIVVDALIWSDKDGDDDDESEAGRNERFERHLSIVQALAETILLPLDASESSRMKLYGATVGLADHPRAAPGLESCLEAIAVGGRDRRRFGSSTKNDNNNAHKSCVGIVCDSVQDLVGYDQETETDAVQGVLQSLTHASLASAATTNDDTKSFSSPMLGYAHQAHRHWRVHKAGLPPEPTLEETRADEENSTNSNMWLFAILAILLAFWWKKEE